MILPNAPFTRPQVPDDLRVFVIGDIHGRADLLIEVQRRIDHSLTARHTGASLEIYLGDYVDRGPASREVLDLLIDRMRTRDAVFLRGNHEAYMVQFLSDPAILTQWQRWGGLETLLSYGIRPAMNSDAEAQRALSAEFDRALPQAHREFLSRLRPSYAVGTCFFAHAGVRPGVPLSLQFEQDLTEIRSEFLEWDGDFGKYVVHGHTPVPEPDIRHNRINIDTGAYATGILTCLVLQGDRMAML